MDDKGDLVAFARESASAGIDLYELLSVDTTTSREDIHRAWRRQGLKYHPDKAGANFDPVLYERFARARDVLVDDAARQVYDTARAAAAQRRLQAEQMTSERRQWKDELEAAERAAAASGGGGAGRSGDAPFGATEAPQSSERDKLREAGRRRAEEQQRQEQEARDRLRQREDERIAEIEKLLREKEERAQRRADKKRAAAPVEETTEYTMFSAPAEAEWKKLRVYSGGDKERPAKVAEGVEGVEGVEGKPLEPTEQMPLLAYTMERLRKAGEVQRKRQAETSGSSTVPAFEPQWEEIQDPQVRKFITRVPRLRTVAAQTAGTAGTTETAKMDMT